ncbi:DUF4003 family protein [Lysinibacillus yapensis]|nr:DUF4003 family protein [Lysinibacillus yapensis]
MDNEQFIKVFLDNYNRIFNYTGGQDLQLMHSLACKYTIANKQFSGVVLHKIIEQFTEDRRHPLPFRLDYKNEYKLAFHLLQQGDVDMAMSRLIENDRLLEQAKFRGSQHRLLAALFLQPGDLEHAKRAKHLYEEMNKTQRLLTSKADIPYVVCLTKNPHVQPREQARAIVQYYRELKRSQFSIGNPLQALAQILTMPRPEYDQILVQSVINIKEELRRCEIKVKKFHYPYIAILALASGKNSKISEISFLYNQLIEQKIFKGAKEYALAAAIQKVASDELEMQKLLELPYFQHFKDFTDLYQLIDFNLDIGMFFPSGTSDFTDFFN